MKKKLARLFTLFFIALLPVTNVRPAQSLNDEQPQVIKAVSPIYPPVALHAHFSGAVTVDVEINAQGSVTSVKASGATRILQIVCEAAAKRWRFSQSASTKLRKAKLTFDFILAPKDTPPSELSTIFLPPCGIEIYGIVPQIAQHENIQYSSPITKTKKQLGR